MKRLRLGKKERTALRDMAIETLELRFDYSRRFRNAILCLTQSDPKWMVWVEQNLPMDGRFRMRDLVLVESRARAVVLKAHGYLGRKNIGDLIFREHWPFTDRGSLSPG